MNIPQSYAGPGNSWDHVTKEERFAREFRLGSFRALARYRAKYKDSDQGLCDLLELVEVLLGQMEITPAQEVSFVRESLKQMMVRHHREKAAWWNRR